MLQVNFKRLMYSDTGRVILSVVLGLGIACLFQKVCKDKECIRFSGPVIQQIDGKVFEYDDKCYQYNARPVQCKADKRTLDFATKDSFGSEPTKTAFGSVMNT